MAAKCDHTLHASSRVGCGGCLHRRYRRGAKGGRCEYGERPGVVEVSFHDGPGADRTAVESRSADFSPPPSGLAKSAGSGLKSALQTAGSSLLETPDATTRNEACPIGHQRTG